MSLRSDNRREKPHCRNCVHFPSRRLRFILTRFAKWISFIEALLCSFVPRNRGANQKRKKPFPKFDPNTTWLSCFFPLIMEMTRSKKSLEYRLQTVLPSLHSPRVIIQVTLPPLPTLTFSYNSFCFMFDEPIESYGMKLARTWSKHLLVKCASETGLSTRY